MRTLLFFLRKEFLQIFRNKGMLPIIFAMPVIQLLVLSYAATFDVTSTRVYLIDEDRTPASRLLVDSFERSGYFEVVDRSQSDRLAGEALLRRDVNMILHVPDDFERDLTLGQPVPVQIILNAEDGAAAGIVQAYAAQIIASVSRDIPVVTVRQPAPPGPQIHVDASYWYNPRLSYKAYMVPGILVILVTMIGAFLSGMNIVKEKETGTIEQLNVTPIRKYQFILGKLLPFWILALAELAFGLVLAELFFHIPMRGSIPLVFLCAAVYLLVVLGIGLWVSTLTETQQQAMFVTWFLVVVFILLSGLFTPIESMPHWAQVLTKINPIAYFISIMRAVLLKGAGFSAISTSFFALVAGAVLMLSLAVSQYRKTTG